MLDVGDNVPIKEYQKEEKTVSGKKAQAMTAVVPLSSCFSDLFFAKASFSLLLILPGCHGHSNERWAIFASQWS